MAWVMKWPLTLSATNDRYTNDAQVAQAIGQYLTRIGIHTKVDTMTQTMFFPQRAKRAGGRGALELAKGLLAVLDEDVADRLARGRAHLGVGIPELHPQPVREQRPDRGFARPRRADQDDAGPLRGHEITRALR